MKQARRLPSPRSSHQILVSPRTVTGSSIALWPVPGFKYYLPLRPNPSPMSRARSECYNLRPCQVHCNVHASSWDRHGLTRTAQVAQRLCSAGAATGGDFRRTAILPSHGGFFSSQNSRQPVDALQTERPNTKMKLPMHYLMNQSHCSCPRMLLRSAKASGELSFMFHAYWELLTATPCLR